MWSRFRRLFISDLIIISNDKTLIAFILIPVILIIILKLIFPPLSHFVFSKTGFVLENYYSIVAITFVAIIPVLTGSLYANIFLSEKGLYIPQSEAVTPPAGRNFLYIRILFSSLVSFVLVLLTILLTNPVPAEGWLRTLFAAVLFSIQATFIFLFIVALAESKRRGFTLSWIYLIFLVALPLGLLLHHPWNYFAFFSPMYWIAWAWITQSSTESMIYGSIALILAAGATIILLSHFLRKHTS